MGLLDEIEVDRRTLVLFFLADTSGGTERAEAVYNAIEELVSHIRTVSAGIEVAQIKIAMMRFSSGAEWVTNIGPEAMEAFTLPGLQAGDRSDMGAACRELAKKLSTEKGGFLRFPHGVFAPVIFMFSGGEPDDDFEDGLAVLQENEWFNQAIKVAIALGSGANKDLLARFSGSPEGVITACDPETLIKWIAFEGVITGRAADASPGAPKVQVSDETVW